MPGGFAPDIRQEAAGLLLSRQVVDHLRGPTPCTYPGEQEAELGGPPMAPNIFPDGSVGNPGCRWASYAGLGVWEAVRRLDHTALRDDEAAFFVRDPM